MKSSLPRTPLRSLLGRVLAAFPLGLSLAASGFAATFYVAPTGNDANAGTLAAPFASIMRAQTAASSGDTVFVRGGTYNTFTIAFTDANYNYVHRLNKSGVNWSAYPGETPVFDFSSVPTNLRVCGFHVTTSGLTVTGFVVTGVKDGTQKQSECFRIDGSGANVAFVDCVAHDNAANGFYFTNHSRGSCTRCDSYNNIGTNGDSIGNTDGFGAHGDGTVFRYCRSWNNSDDGYDCISATGSNTFDHCWAYNMRAGGDSNGFKVGGYGSGTVPSTVPSHTVTYCLSANNNAHGFYANHQPSKAADWLHNSAFNQSAGNFDMLERVSPTDITDISGYREVLHYNVSFTGTIIKDDANPPDAVTENSWTKPGVTVTSADFLSVDASQMIAPRSAGNNMPFITFMHLAPGSDLAGLGAFEPAPAAPTNVQAAWVNSGRVDLTWTASPGATEYYVRRATTSGGPYTSIAVRLSGTSFSDTTVGGNATYYYQVSAMNNISYDEGASAEVAATIPPVAITAVITDTGRFANDAVTSDPTLILNGTAGAASSIVVTRIGVGTIGTTTANGSGAWSFDYTGTSLPAGTHTFTVTATDAISGTSFTSDPFAVTVDTTSPAPPVVASVASAPGAFVISGTSEPLGQVFVTIDGSTSAGSTIAAADGSWSLSYAGALSADVHAFTATVTDLAGNASGTSAALTIDTRIATPAILAAQTDFGSVSNGGVTRDKTISLTGTAGPGNTVTLTRAGAGVIGSTAANGSGNWSFDYTGTVLPDGTNSFTASGSTGGGTGPSSSAFTFVVDSIPPAAVSIVRQNPTTATVTSAVTALVYRVTFSEGVSGVDTGDFTLATTGGAAGTIASVSASTGTIFDVTVNNLSGGGTLRLDLKSSGTNIADAAGNLAGGFTTGDIYTRVISSSGSGTWIQAASGGLWSDAVNWLNAVIPNASTHTANFATLEIAGTNIVHLDSARTINAATFGDTTTATPGTWFLDNNGVAANTLTLAGTVPTLTVNALGTDATATIGARLAGNGGLTKAGAGTLVVAGASTLTGALNTTGGNLRIDSGGSLSHTTVGVGTGSQLTVNGGSLTASGATTVTGATNTSLIVNDGTAAFAALAFNSSAGDGALIAVNGGTVTAASVSIPRNTNQNIVYNTGFVVTGGATTVTGAVNLGTSNSNGTMSVEGGSLTVNGVITVANQTTGTRGGAMRVIGGAFTSTNTASGIVLSKTNGSNANNVSFATFSGGVSNVEKFTLGADGTVTAGSATITVDGGELYVGSGGIVKGGAAGLVTNLNFSGGTVGAKANWSTALPINLPVGGNVAFKAASSADAPFGITLSGVLSGAGGFTKIGAGALTLLASNTFSGSVALNAGTLNLTGSLASGGSLAVNAGGTFAGTGTSNKAITLNTGGAISPAGTATGTLSGASLTWNGGGALAFDLGASADRLTLSGALTEGTAGTFAFNFTSGAGVAIGNVYTLVSFGSTTFSASDFSFTGLPAGMTGAFSIVGGQLRFTIMGPPVITSATTANGTFAAAFNYTITATNLPTNFSATGLPAGLVLDSATGIISGAPATNGTFPVTISATNGAGTGSTTLTLSIARAPVSVALSNLTATYDGSPHAASVTTSPSVGFIVTYNGSETAPTDAGNYNVVVTLTDSNYIGGATGTLKIAKASQTITFPNPGPKTYGDPTFALGASADSHLAIAYTVVSGPVTLSGNLVTITGAGTATIRAAQAGNNNYLAAAPVDVTFSIAKASATVALSNLQQAYDGTPKSVTATTTPADLNVTITYDGSTAAPTLPGSYAVVATVVEPNYTGSANGTLVITITALVRHAPDISGGIDGSVQMLTPEALKLTGDSFVSNDVLVPGSPHVLDVGHSTLTSVQDGGGANAPANYQVLLTGNSLVRYVVRRVDPIALPTVTPPLAPTGTRDVVLNSEADDLGDPATLLNLTANGGGTSIALPPGAYGAITINGGTELVLGMANSTTPSVYHLQALTLDGAASVRLAGPVMLKLATDLTLDGSLGVPEDPASLVVELAAGSVTLKGNATVHAIVTAPAGEITISGNATLHGRVVADRLTISGNGLLHEN